MTRVNHILLQRRLFGSQVHCPAWKITHCFKKKKGAPSHIPNIPELQYYIHWSAVLTNVHKNNQGRPKLQPKTGQDVAQYGLWLMVSWGVSSQTWIKTSVSSCTACAGTWWQWMRCYMMSQRCWIGFRPWEGVGQSISSMFSSSRKCWHTPGTYHTQCHAPEGAHMICADMCWYHTAARVSFLFPHEHIELCGGPPRTCPPLDITHLPMQWSCWEMLQSVCV